MFKLSLLKINTSYINNILTYFPTFKFDDRSIHSNSKYNNTKLVQLKFVILYLLRPVSHLHLIVPCRLSTLYKDTTDAVNYKLKLNDFVWY